MALRLPDAPTFPAPERESELVPWGGRIANLATKLARETFNAIRDLQSRAPAYVECDFISKATEVETFPRLLKNPLAREPLSVTIAQLRAPASPSVAMQLLWDIDGAGNIRINGLVEFTAATEYRLLLEVR